jgi:hypothetical protein
MNEAHLTWNDAYDVNSAENKRSDINIQYIPFVSGTNLHVCTSLPRRDRRAGAACASRARRTGQLENHTDTQLKL